MSHWKESSAVVVVLALASWGMWAVASTSPVIQPGGRLATGKFITPVGSHVDVGSHPSNLILSPDGRFLVASTIGHRQQLSVISTASGELVSKVDFGGRGKKGLYYGLAFDGQNRLYASRGAEDLIGVFQLNADGTLVPVRDLENPRPKEVTLPLTAAGLAVSADGKMLLTVNNQTSLASQFKGSLSQLGLDGADSGPRIELPGFPFAIAAITKGAEQSKKAYVTSERDGVVAVVDLVAGKVAKTIATGAAPTMMTLNRDQTRLFVANASSDTLSVIDTTTDRVLRTVLLRPAALRGLPGSTPLGVSLSPDETRAYIAMADLNAIAVVDLKDGDLAGYIPAGWYPTSVVCSPDGKSLFVANAKGRQAQNPNGKAVADRGQYVLNIIEGTVAKIDLGAELNRLEANTVQVLANNTARPEDVARVKATFNKPEIDYVIYVIKENRTYDQVLSDLPKGNNDPSLLLFGRDVTPNQHALAERFVQLDNFHVCAEVSADGWNWSTSGMVNAYTARNSVTNYAGRGRAYDFEGTNNGVAVDLREIPDVATAPGGYIWDACVKAKVSFRNYGVFLAFDASSDDKRSSEHAADNMPTKRNLMDATDPHFRRYDMNYADSEAWIKHGLPAAPKQLVEFGAMKDKSRMSAWLRDYDRLLKEDKVPKFMILRLGRDHTSGTTAGTYSPRAMVAENDYAVGQLVEAVSKGRLWENTAIFVLEDDAQAGFDHVDAHRSIAFVISPWVKRNSLDSRFYNTDSMLHTMSEILGLATWNQYVATSPLMDVFATAPTNREPFTAILPPRDIIGEINKPTAYRAADSERLLNPMQEESDPDMELNDILWRSIKGADVPRPVTPRARWSARFDELAEDDD